MAAKAQKECAGSTQHYLKLPTPISRVVVVFGCAVVVTAGTHSAQGIRASMEVCCVTHSQGPTVCLRSPQVFPSPSFHSLPFARSNCPVSHPGCTLAHSSCLPLLPSFVSIW